MSQAGKHDDITEQYMLQTSLLDQIHRSTLYIAVSQGNLGAIIP